MIDFKALPKFSGASRVIEIIVANIAEVDSKLEPTASADEAASLGSRSRWPEQVLPGAVQQRQTDAPRARHPE